MKTEFTKIITLLLISVFFGLDAAEQKSGFVLYSLQNLSREKISTHRTLAECLQAGSRLQSIECFQIWKGKKRKKEIHSAVMDICNQDGK